MNVDPYPDPSTQKRAGLPGWAAWMLDLLRKFWLTGLAWLAVALYGLRAGWTTPMQWSDGLFFDAVAQIAVAAIMMLVPTGEALDASSLRYVDHGNVEDTRLQLVRDTLRRKQFGLRALLGGVLTMLLAWLALRF